MSNINSEYAKSLIGSFYGCDGGNPNYPIWFCGIEHGGDFQSNKKEIANSFKEQKKFDNPSSWSKDDSDYAGSVSASGNLNRYICSIYAYYSGLADLDSTFPFDQAFVDQNKILCKGGVGFKMNLFPFCKKSLYSEPTSEFDKLINGNYLDEVLTTRRSFFHQQINQHKTKLIICFGISKISEFYNFFAQNPQEPIPESLNFLIKYDETTDKVINYYEFNCTENCKVIVMPFLGRPSGFNGYYEMFQFAEILKLRNLS